MWSGMVGPLCVEKCVKGCRMEKNKERRMLARLRGYTYRGGVLYESAPGKRHIRNAAKIMISNDRVIREIEEMKNAKAEKRHS